MNGLSAFKRGLKEAAYCVHQMIIKQEDIIVSREMVME